MSDIAKRLAALSPEQRALLEQRLKQKKQDAGNSAIPTQDRQAAVLPLSFAQERLWVMYQLDPQSSLYNIPVVLPFGAAFDTAVDERVFQEIIRRHEILRTTFATIDRQPAQRIAPAADFKLPVIDLRHLPLAEQEAEAER